MATAPDTWRAFYAARDSKDARTYKRLRDRIVQENLGLVKSMAIKTARMVKGGYEDADDLIQAGTIGLLYAIDRFILDKGFQFSTYATHWIRKEFIRVRVSEEVVKRRPENRMPAAILARIIRFRQAYGCEPGPEDLGEHKGEPVTSEQLLAWLEHSYVCSLDTSTSDDQRDGAETFNERNGAAIDAASIGATLHDPTPLADDVIDAAENARELREEIEDVCSPSERHAILGYLFENKTCEELAAESGIRKQSVNASQARAIRKLAEGRVRK